MCLASCGGFEVVDRIKHEGYLWYIGLIYQSTWELRVWVACGVEQGTNAPLRERTRTCVDCLGTIYSVLLRSTHFIARS